MKYVIYSKCLNKTFSETSDEKTYNELHQSKKILSEVRSKENIYNIVLMNYYEFEQELFSVILDHEVFYPSYKGLNDYLLKIEQRILNLLSSITLYLESFKFEKPLEEDIQVLSVEYQKTHEFIEDQASAEKIKIMKFLRNHLQHNALLIETFSLKGVNLSDDLREETFVFHIDKSSIKARNFKIEEFSGIEDKIDLKKYIREYMDFVSEVHHCFREETNVKVISARENFNKILTQYSEYKSLHIAKIEHEVQVEEIPILLEWDDIRVDMVEKNRVPKCFKRHSINTK